MRVLGKGATKYTIQCTPLPSLPLTSQARCGSFTRLWQEAILGRLCICDLVNDQTNTALRDDVRDTVSDLDGNHSLSCIDAKHGEQVHNRVSAPADHCHDLGCPDLARDDWVRLTVCGRSEAHEQLIDDVQEEGPC